MGEYFWYLCTNFCFLFPDWLEEWIHVISIPNKRATRSDITRTPSHCWTERIDLTEIRGNSKRCDFTLSSLQYKSTSRTTTHHIIYKTVQQNWCLYTFTNTMQPELMNIYLTYLSRKLKLFCPIMNPVEKLLYSEISFLQVLKIRVFYK